MTCLLLGLFAFSFEPASLQDGESPGDEILLKELQARGLNQLTEAYSRRRLGNEKLPPAEREAAAVELAMSTSRRASTEVSALARREGWKESDDLMEPWLRAAVGVDPEAFEFRLRRAIMIRERAETAIELLKAVPGNKELAADAREQALKAAAALSELHSDIRKRSNRLAGGDPKLIARVHDLDHQANFQAGIAWSLAAIASPAGAERVKASEEAEHRLREYARSFSLLRMNMEAILALGRLYKEVERYEEAIQLVSVFDLHPEAPAVYRQRAVLLAAQILLAQNKASEALLKLDVSEDKRLPNSGEWSLTLFEAMLRASRRDIDAPKSRRKNAIDLLASLETKFGGYWKARGQQILAKFGDEDVVGDDASLLALVATLRKENKEYDAAVAMFDRAAKLEREANAPDRAARMALAAAGTVFEKGDAASAAKRYLELAKELDQSPLAADALLGAAGSLHKSATTGDVNALAAYRESLDRLLALPKSEPALKHEAHWLRGRLAESEKDSAAAVAHYREIPTEHSRAAVALGALAALHHDNLLGASGKLAGDRTIAAATEDLETRLKALSGDAPIVAKQRAVGAWVLARLIAEHFPERLADAVKLVESTVVVEPSFPVAQNKVWQTLLGWKIRLGDVDGAKAVMARGFVNDPKGLFDAMQRFSPLEEGIVEKEASTRADAASAAVDLWLGKSDQLPERTRAGLKLLAGQALAARKDYSAAVRTLRQLREESPRDARGARTLARVLYLAGEYRESLTEWNKLLNGLPRGGEDWLTAVAEAVRCHLELGDRALAGELLKLVETTYKGKGSEAVRRRFDDLRKRAER